MELSIIIVNYNVTKLLENCILSIKKYVKGVKYEIIVIDNASQDSSWKNLIEKYPEVYFIENQDNLGFSKANNKAIYNAKGEYVLLLNPDTEIEEDKMREVLDFAKSKQNFGCLGVRLHDAEGNFLPESKRAVPNLFNSFEKLFTNFKKNQAKSYYRNDIDEFEISEIEVITGAFLLCEREKYLQIGGLDERYFMYGEDIDLCYTFLQNGYQNYYYGEMSVLHIKGESTIKDKVYLQRFYGAMQIFLDKYYRENKLQYYALSLGLKLKYFLEKMKL